MYWTIVLDYKTLSKPGSRAFRCSRALHGNGSDEVQWHGGVQLQPLPYPVGFASYWTPPQLESRSLGTSSQGRRTSTSWLLLYILL